jgi:hypothetical protein
MRCICMQMTFKLPELILFFVLFYFDTLTLKIFPKLFLFFSKTFICHIFS